MANLLFEILFPKRCVGCKKVGAYLCGVCFRRLELVSATVCLRCDRPAINGLVHPGCKTRYMPEGYTAVFTFKSPVKELIYELKYRGVADIATLCSQFMAKAVPQHVLDKKPIVMAVPLHKKKLLQRGFNQSQLLAKEISRELQLRLNSTSLHRTRMTQTQAKLHRDLRKSNTKDAFVCANRLDGQSILLVDDTITTGATLVACTHALKKMGATFVWAITLSQAPCT